MTAREQDHADRQIDAIRDAHWYRVCTVAGLLVAGLLSWALVYLLAARLARGAQ